MAAILSLLSQLPQLVQALIAVLGAIVAVLGAVLVVAKMIPGDYPDNAIQKLIDGISAFMKKFQ